MISAGKHTNETRRLKALCEYHTLDTRPEKALDDLTTLAATICGAPMAMISLVDEKRQWFKSRVGRAASETPREISFCAHTLLETDLLIVPDAAADARFADSPLVTGEPHLRFYAGAPLLTPEGEALGALCVHDCVPRTLTPEQQQALRVLSRQVMTHLELRRRTRELSESEELLRIVTDSARVGVVIVNRERRYEYANAAYAEIHGLPSASIVGQRVADVLAANYEEQIGAWLDRAFAGEGAAFDLHKPAADGDRHYAVRYEPTMVEGSVDLVVVVISDITARKQAEEARAESGLFTQSIIDALSVELCVLDESGTFLSTNEAWRRFAEANPPVTHRADAGSNYLEVCDAVTGPEAADAAAFTAGIRAVLRGERADFAMEYPCHSPTEQRWFVGRVTRFPGDGPVRVVVAHENITERKQAELPLLQLASIVASSDDAIIGKNLNGVITSWNRGAEKIFGYTPAEMVGTSILRLIPADRKGEEMHILSKIRQGESVEHLETRRLTKDGRLIEVSVTASPIKDASGKVLGVSKVARNITTRKRNEARFRWLVDSNAQGVIFWNRRGEITSSNDAFLKMVRYSREDLESGGVNWVAMTPTEYVAADEHALQELTAKGACAPFEKEYLRKDGSRVPVLIASAVFEDNPDEGVCFVLDLTERKKLEQQFLRAQRMESIGTLAGGIAHDLNNVLGPIMISLELLKMRFSDPESQEILSILESSAHHGAAMVRQVLSFGRGLEGLRMQVQVRHLIRDIETITTETFPKHILVRTEVPQDLWTISADPTQLHQVLLNLCVNARDAMPDGGTLTLSAENFTVDAQYASLNLDKAKPGTYVFLQVEDTGTGIPQDVIEKIFDPFFTTKEVGKGTGLGLSTSMGIVTSHGGFLRVYSEVGRGTRFMICLPAQSEVSTATVAASQPELPRGDGELILVVDDEPSARQMMQQTLEAFGYRVLLASEGADGLAVFAPRMGEISAVLTDMSMPIMDGPATIRVLRRMSPRLRIIAMSGLSENGHAAQVAGLGVKHFLPKPFTAETLLKALKQLLAAET